MTLNKLVEEQGAVLAWRQGHSVHIEIQSMQAGRPHLLCTCACICTAAVLTA